MTRLEQGAVWGIDDSGVSATLSVLPKAASGRASHVFIKFVKMLQRNAIKLLDSSRLQPRRDPSLSLILSRRHPLPNPPHHPLKIPHLIISVQAHAHALEPLGHGRVHDGADEVPFRLEVRGERVWLRREERLDGGCARAGGMGSGRVREEGDEGGAGGCAKGGEEGGEVCAEVGQAGAALVAVRGG